MRCNVIKVMMGYIVAMSFGLAGCGGGGGSSSIISSSYKGTTTQATVTTSNAKAVSVDAIQGAQNVASVGVLGKSVAEIHESSPQILTIAKILEVSVSRVSPKAVVAKTVAATVQQTVYGHSGSFSFTINGNDSTGAFSGTITFNSYEENSYAPIISGNVSFIGVVNTSTSTITSVDMSMSNLQGVIGSDSYTLNGSIALSSNGITKTLNISAVRLDNTNNNTYWTKDFSFVLTGNRLTIKGTYYDHVHGYVVVTTVTPLTVLTYSSTPTSGQLLFTGSNGTKARLTYKFSGYTLDVDVSGNNTYVLIP